MMVTGMMVTGMRVTGMMVTGMMVFEMGQYLAGRAADGHWDGAMVLNWSGFNQRVKTTPMEECKGEDSSLGEPLMMVTGMMVTGMMVTGMMVTGMMVTWMGPVRGAPFYFIFAMRRNLPLSSP
ncbi:hypothetical protein ACOMHN_023321 [Nucella lapillus]